MAMFVAAIRIPHHPSNGVADRHKGELDRRNAGAPRPQFDRHRSILMHNSLSIELYLSITVAFGAR
jgi:hypothetical protein